MRKPTKKREAAVKAVKDMKNVNLKTRFIKAADEL